MDVYDEGDDGAEDEAEEVGRVEADEADLEEGAGGHLGVEFLLVGDGDDEAAEEEEEIDAEVGVREVDPAEEAEGMELNDGEGGEAAEGVEREVAMLVGGLGGCGWLHRELSIEARKGKFASRFVARLVRRIGWRRFARVAAG